MTNKNRVRFSISSLIAVISLSLSGCKLTNPYIDDTKLVDSNGNATNYCNPLTENPSNAIACSSALKSEYIDGMGEQATLTSLTGIGLIPLTAFTIGFAANGESATKISDFALGTAGLFSLSNWLTSPERTRIYALGHQALQCAEQASMPFLIAFATNEQRERDAGDTGLNEYVVQVNTAISAVNFAVIPQSPLASEFAAAKTEAQEAKQQAAELATKFNQAPGALITHTQRINSAVNLALTSSIQSLSALPSILNGMGDLYTDNKKFFNGFVPATDEDSGVSGTDSQGLPPAQEAQLTTQLKAIKVATKQLQYYVNSITPKPAANTLESCGIDTTQLVGGLTATPASLEFASNTITHSVSVNGGSGTYVYEASAQFEIDQNTPFGGVFSIKVKEGSTQNGNYFIKIKDSTGRIIDVPMAIKKINASPTNGGGEGSSNETCALSGSLQAAEKSLCTDKVKTLALQATLNAFDGISVGEDGDYGAETRAAIVAFAQHHEHLIDEVSELNIQAITDYQNQTQLEEAKLNTYLDSIGVSADRSNQIDKIKEAQVEIEAQPTGFVSADLL
ncbi:peptidoglycan-binding protein [Alteromonas sp. R78001]|uniref:peptidoglycan-binding domain-containing protein n=1 Tax=Alteromonas sp. R78001 TaxID=3093865 RepID=UPI00366C5373